MLLLFCRIRRSYLLGIGVASDADTPSELSQVPLPPVNVQPVFYRLVVGAVQSEDMSVTSYLLLGMVLPV